MQKIMQHVVRQLKRIKDVKAIILYGSYARGKQKPLSDIDLCILTERILSDDQKALISSHSSPTLQISLFWELPTHVRYAALREGKVLFLRDKALLHEATFWTMHDYLDFKWVIDKAIARAGL